MSRVAAIIPAEDDLLCEGCGYTLNGLPDESNCPECGKPIAESTGVGRREPPPWERATRSRAGAFLTTSVHVLFRPTHFYRTLATRRDTRRAKTFAHIHWAVVAAMFGAAAAIHLEYVLGLRPVSIPRMYDWTGLTVTTVLFAILAYLAIAGTTWLAAALSAWEGAYRGLRLPRGVVQRGLYYHAPHYLPVAVAALLTVLAYHLMGRFNLLSPSAAIPYLYVLSAEVIAGAVYLFWTYWIGMRNMMYANR